jgi:hypothetical protein
MVDEPMHDKNKSINQYKLGYLYHPSNPVELYQISMIAIRFPHHLADQSTKNFHDL